MTDQFTKPELYTLVSGLDALVRVEGRALAENGIQAIHTTLGQLNLRLTACVTAHAKLMEVINAPPPAPPAQPETEKAAEVEPPTVQAEPTHAKRGNGAAAH